MKPPSPKISAFTLVEVTMAIGIVSFALLALIGLIPTGLGSMRESSRQSINALILQRVSSDLVVRGFSNRADFSSFGGTNLFFDEDAQLIPGVAGARYKADITVRDPSLPGVSGSDAEALSNSFKRLGISITRVDIPNAATNSYSLQLSYR